ncbi:MAG: AMP-binding protein [Betaproteobacteria bacterium]
MNIANWLARTANTFSAHNALVQGADVRNAVSYREFARRAAAIAHALATQFHCRPGDRIALLAANHPDCMEALYGIWWAGCVAVPINAKLHAREAAFIFDDAQVSLAFVSSEWAAALDAARREANASDENPPEQPLIVLGSPACLAMRNGASAALAAREPEDLAWLFYTSGTTGKPKGAMLSHRNLAAMTFNYFTDVDSVECSDCILHAAPVSHGSGLYNFAHVLRGAAQVFPDSGGFDPAEIIELLKTHSGLAMFAAPTMVKRLTAHVAQHGGAEGFANLKTIVYGGGPMYLSDLKEALDTFGQKFVQIYGQGESPMTITALSRFHHADSAHPRHEVRLASVGVAHSGMEVRVADENGDALPAGESGEILVRGDTVMSGYWSNPEATAQSLKEGWLYTGDLGAMDEDGFLTLKDRSKDVIISGGSNIYPREVEEALLLHPSVLEVSVVGRPDAEWGETVVAFVVAREGAALDSSELDQYCLERIARFKRPKEYRMLPALPKNNYGKVLKTELRKIL